jgi:hypothetical protein
LPGFVLNTELPTLNSEVHSEERKSEECLLSQLLFASPNPSLLADADAPLSCSQRTHYLDLIDEKEVSKVKEVI